MKRLALTAMLMLMGGLSAFPQAITVLVDHGDGTTTKYVLPPLAITNRTALIKKEAPPPVVKEAAKAVAKATEKAVPEVLAVSTNLPSKAEIRKAMDKYREENPLCAVCDAKKSVNGNRCEVHHVLAQSFRPDLAADPRNFRTLCRRHHQWVGHMNNFKTYNGELLPTIDAIRKAYTNNAVRVTKPKKAPTE